MTRFTISGSPQEILAKLEAAKVVAEMRNEEGWILFQDDEEWEYIPIWDRRLCPVCESFAGSWIGEQIPIEFHQWRREHPLQGLRKNEVYPNTHESVGVDYLHGTCRCVLEWLDYLYVLTNRLFNEMEAAST